MLRNLLTGRIMQDDGGLQMTEGNPQVRTHVHLYQHTDQIALRQIERGPGIAARLIYRFLLRNGIVNARPH